jgi:hypothetical protein
LRTAADWSGSLLRGGDASQQKTTTNHPRVCRQLRHHGEPIIPEIWRKSKRKRYECKFPLARSLKLGYLSTRLNDQILQMFEGRH